MERPLFEKIKDYQEFSKYYWYKTELKQICKRLGIESDGTKQELNDNIAQYYQGQIVNENRCKIKSVDDVTINLDTGLLECGFSFNQKFRKLFSQLTKIDKFKFNADMAATWRMVKKKHDTSFTIQDMLDVYYGKKEYAKYDNSLCQWNKFLKDFCQDANNSCYKNKIKVAAILWHEVRNSTEDKIYTKELTQKYADLIKDYRIL